MPSKRKRKTRSKRKGQDVRNSKRETLLREMKLSVSNTERYRRIWREMLMRIKMSDIERKIEIAWQTLEHALDLKDYSISLLLDSLQEAEDQHRKVNYAHVETLDRSLQSHEARLTIVDTVFHRDIEEALTDKTREFERINRYRSNGESVLHRIILLVNRRDENIWNIAKSTAIGKVDNFAEDGRNERRIITTQLQKQLETLWDDLRSVFSDYRKSTANRRKAYQTIRRKDEFDRQEVIRQCQRTAALLEEIARCREKIHSYRIDATAELQEITRESNFFHTTYREWNEYFILGYKKDKHRIMIMSKEYNRSVKHLKKLIMKAEHILTYVQICRKYETQDEKIIPTIDNYYATFQTRSDTMQTNGLSLESATEDFRNSINFWRRLGFAQLITTELRIERDRLYLRMNNLRKSVTHRLTNETLKISTC